MTSTTPYGDIGVQSNPGPEFKVNGQRLKHFVGEHIDIVELIVL